MSFQSNSTDLSGTITTGGVAQVLSAVPIEIDGILIHNPDPANDLWMNEGGTAAANTAGSVRIPANGGEWWTQDTHRFNMTNTTIVGAVTGQQFTIKYWRD